MKQLVSKAAEVFLARLVPGAITVFSLMVLATWLSAKAYGLASTYMATSGAIANFVFGPLLQSGIVAHAEHTSAGTAPAFERSHVTNSLVFATALTLCGLLIASLGLFDWRVVVAAAAFGLYTSLLQIPRARLEFLRFALGSTSQSIALLILAFVLVRPVPTVERALDAFALSYAIGAAVSAGLVKARLAQPTLDAFKKAFAMGTAAALNNTAADVFTLGCRYLLIALRSFDTLGVFAFSVDLAQKTVGIIINFATFAIVPHALRAGASDITRLWRMLLRGWSAAVCFSLLSVVAVIGLGFVTSIPALHRPVYDPISFLLISIAVIVGRTGKMLFTPVAIRLRETKQLLVPFVALAPLSLLFVAAGVSFRWSYPVECGYLLAFGSWTAAGYWLLGRSLARRA